MMLVISWTCFNQEDATNMDQYTVIIGNNASLNLILRIAFRATSQTVCIKLSSPNLKKTDSKQDVSVFVTLQVYWYPRNRETTICT